MVAIAPAPLAVVSGILAIRVRSAPQTAAQWTVVRIYAGIPLGTTVLFLLLAVVMTMKAISFLPWGLTAIAAMIFFLNVMGRLRFTP